MGSGQRRHRDRRPRLPVQRLRLSEAAGSPARHDAARPQPVPDRLRAVDRRLGFLRRRRPLRLHDAAAARRHRRGARDFRAGRHRLPALLRQLHQRRRRGSPRRSRVGRRGRCLRRGRARRGGDDVERRSRHRRDRYVRDGDAERPPRRRSDARAVRTWTIGARARSPHRPAERGRRHVRRSVFGSMARVRSGPSRVRLQVHPAPRTDDGARHLRRERT